MPTQSSASPGCLLTKTGTPTMLCEVAPDSSAPIQVLGALRPGTETSGTQPPHCVLPVVTCAEARHFLSDKATLF